MLLALYLVPKLESGLKLGSGLNLESWCVLVPQLDYLLERSWVLLTVKRMARMMGLEWAMMT